MLKNYLKVVIKLLLLRWGDKGVLLLDKNNKITINPKSVVPIDTTGAGDTFIGGVAAGLLSGLNVVRAVELANIAASISVTREGAASSIPTIDEVNKTV